MMRNVSAFVLLGGTILAGCRPASLQSRVDAIQEMIRRIDDVPQGSVEKKFYHWTFSGTFDQAQQPLRLKATFTEGVFVRDEAYYFQDGRLIYALVVKYSDAEEPA